MDMVQALIEMFRANADIIPDPLAILFRWLLGIFLVLAIAVAIGRLMRTPACWLWPKIQYGLRLSMQGVAAAIEDPTEHRFLKHLVYVGNLIFSCLGFLIFFFAGLGLILLFAFASPNLSAWRPLAAGGFIVLLFLFAAFFKAEAGRTLIAYRLWRRNA